MPFRVVSKTISWLQQLDGRMLWRVDPQPDKGPVGRTVYLTFDDGPIPEVTPWVLDTLKGLGVKATFFCIGQNVVNNPAIFDRLKAEGHAVGNHTWDHPSGWRTSARAYYRTVLKCQAVTSTDMFRPPYGRITNRQINALRKRFQVVMWDVLAGDFEDGMTGADCVDVVMRRTRPGSIIVFHDNLISQERMRHALPVVVRRLLDAGYRFETLPHAQV
jgi:peptidoglycan/xylan/chitin deacetylase (PgdA/CDA1 family)